MRKNPLAHAALLHPAQQLVVRAPVAAAQLNDAAPAQWLPLAR